MPRQAKPIFYRDPRRDKKRDDGWWCLNVTDNGKRRRVRLAEGKKNHKAAMQRFHEFQAARAAGEPVRTRPALSGAAWLVADSFLKHAEVNVSPKTYRGYSDFLNDFFDFHPGDLLVRELKVHHVTEWLDSHATWGSSTKSGAVGAVRRCFKWAFEQGIISAYPFPGMKAPRKAVRETVISPDEFARILERSKPDLQDLLNFLWYTGARPQEARVIEPKHVDLENRRVILPPSQAKGKRFPRVIYLTDQGLAIVQRLLRTRTKGKLFRPSGGEEWTSNAVRQRFQRMAKHLGGARFCSYNFRHSFATHSLTAGVDSTTVGVLMGHADPSMVGRVYQHLAKAPKFLQEQVQKARG